MTYTYQKGTPGLGTTLALTPDGGSSTPIAQIMSVEPPSSELGTWDASGLASTWEEVLPTLLKGGEIGLKLTYDGANASHTAIWNAHRNKVACAFVLTYPAAVGPGITGTVAHTASGYCYITGWAPTGGDKENYFTVDVKMKVTGEITLAAAS